MAGTGTGTGDVSYSALVHQAVGMMSVQMAVSVDVALDRLRATAVVTDESVDEIAAQVVSGTLRFEP